MYQTINNAQVDMKGKAMGGELMARNFFVGKITGETRKESKRVSSI